MTHVALDLAADFAAHRLAGTATLTVHSTPAAREIVLDTRDLAIEAVTDGQGRPLDTSCQRLIRSSVARSVSRSPRTGAG